MSGANRENIFVQVVIILITVGMAFNLIPGIVAALATVAGLTLLIVTKQIDLPALIASLVLFGEPFFHTFKGALGLRIAYIFVLLTFAIAFVIIRYRKNPDSHFNQPAVPVYLAGLAFLYIVIIHGPVVGKMTDRNFFFMQLFLVYCTYYTSAGIMVSRSKVEIRDLLVPGFMLYCCVFPLIEIPIHQIAQSSSGDHFGLRSVETFGTIGNARQSGLLLVLTFYVFITAKNKMRIIAPAMVSASLALPVLWFSYTRQAMLAVFMLVLLIGTLAVFKKDLARGIRRKLFAAVVTVTVVAGAVGWVYWASTHVKTARITSENILGGESMAGRPEVWEQSWYYIQKKPLTGYGLGGYYELGLGEWPHNWFLEAWLEHGLIGLSLFILAAFLLLKPFMVSSNPWLTGWTLLGLYWFIVIQFSSNIPQNTLIFFFITISTITNASRLTVQDRKERRMKRMQRLKAEEQPT